MASETERSSDKPAARKRRRRMTALAAPVAKVTGRSFGRRGFAEGQIIRDWPAIAGPLVAAHTLPERITYEGRRRDQGTLKLRVGRSGLALEIQHLEPLIIERVNRYFGYPAVKKLALVQSVLPDPPPPRQPRYRALTAEEEADLDAETDIVTDPDLRAALKRLGEAVKGRKA